MSNASDQSSKRRVIAETLAEALLDSGQLSQVESDLQAQGVHLNLSSDPSISEVESALENLLGRNPEIVPAEKFFRLPTDDRAEWATDQLNIATSGASHLD